MRKDKFAELWNHWSKEWVENAMVTVNGIPMRVSQFCSVKKSIEGNLWRRYEESKRRVKELYFYGSGKRINKYKRAAVLTYVISSAIPLDYNIEQYTLCLNPGANKRSISELPDELFLKQRLAVHIGLCSILMDYDENMVAKLPKPIFHFPELSAQEKSDCDEEMLIDDFLLSVYKDLFFAEIYHNRNVLTLANLYWLLTESSELRNIPAIEN